MGKKKSKGFGKYGKRTDEKLNITSLMDALTIILIFLLVNYSDVSEEAELPDFVNMPRLNEKVTSAVDLGIVVAVGARKIKIGKDHFINYRSFASEEDRILESYKLGLEKIKSGMNIGEGEEAAKNKKKVRVSFQADKTIQYETIEKLIQAANEVGVNFFDLVAEAKQE